jgi:hypothetical protein
MQALAHDSRAAPAPHRRLHRSRCQAPEVGRRQILAARPEAEKRCPAGPRFAWRGRAREERQQAEAEAEAEFVARVPPPWAAAAEQAQVLARQRGEAHGSSDPYPGRHRASAPPHEPAAMPTGNSPALQPAREHIQTGRSVRPPSRCDRNNSRCCSVSWLQANRGWVVGGLQRRSIGFNRRPPRKFKNAGSRSASTGCARRACLRRCSRLRLHHGCCPQDVPPTKPW